MRSIATLKFVGAPDRTIIGLIVEQALALGIVSFVIGLAVDSDVSRLCSLRRLVISARRRFVVVGAIMIVVCLAASTFGIRLALKVDPAEALAGAG